MYKLLRVTAYVQRFVKKLKAAIGKMDEITEPNLTVEEILESRELWLKEMQRRLPEKKEFPN